MSDRCSVCGAWLWSSSRKGHVCPPLFSVSVLGEDDPIEVRAQDAESAAEKWASEYDSCGDYTIIGGQPIRVEVTARDGTKTIWTVTGEAVPEYSAREVNLDSECGYTPPRRRGVVCTRQKGHPMPHRDLDGNQIACASVHEFDDSKYGSCYLPPDHTGDHAGRVWSGPGGDAGERTWPAKTKESV